MIVNILIVRQSLNSVGALGFENRLDVCSIDSEPKIFCVKSMVSFTVILIESLKVSVYNESILKYIFYGIYLV